MSPQIIIFLLYMILGLLILIFSKQISEFLYKLVLVMTKSLNMSQLFLFKVDKKNRDYLFALTRYITILFGFFLWGISIYYIFLL